MSENIRNTEGSGSAMSKAVIAKMLCNNFERLPDIDQKMFLYGPWYLSGNAAFAGAIANSLYRRALNVTQARFSSNLPMLVLPFLTTGALYNVAVSQPLLSGDLNCPTCAVLRGGLIGVVAGVLYPIILALPMNIGLATRYSTALIPEKGAVLRYSLDISRPVLRRMTAVVLLQAVFGSYLGSRDFETYAKLAQITFGQREELKD